ncbi:MAG: hypothetical protein LBU51_04120 [Bacteroidales bacterium]|nr:hypothetical protein [Bacteroidales bacterium]
MNNLASRIEDVKKTLAPTELAHGEILFNNNDCTLLSQSAVSIDFMVTDDGKQMEVSLIFDNIDDNLHIVPECDGERIG